MKINIAIVGAGLIGRKRALSLPKETNLSIVCDTNKNIGLSFAKEFNCQYKKDWRNVVKDKNIKALIISTTNNWLASIAEKAILTGKHVLIEKPGARNLAEFNSIYRAYKKNPVVVMVGYNHRHHPSIIKAKELIDSQKFGEILFIRARYGHGGRLGYENEWRFIKEISGGGELLDQGSHLIDLVNFFTGPMNQVKGATGRLFWKSNLEDSAFFILSNEKKQIAHLSATCIEWKNIFSFEIMLKTAKIQIDGLGRSYGKEKLILYIMKPEMGPPDVEEFEFPNEDDSWKLENELFFKNICQKNYLDNSIKEAIYVLKIIEKLYKNN